MCASRRVILRRAAGPFATRCRKPDGVIREDDRNVEANRRFERPQTMNVQDVQRLTVEERLEPAAHQPCKQWLAFRYRRAMHRHPVQFADTVAFFPERARDDVNGMLLLCQRSTEFDDVCGNSADIGMKIRCDQADSHE